MEGILYLSDSEQKKRFVQIDLNIFGDIWEDLEDILAIHSRKNEERISLEDVLKKIDYQPQKLLNDLSLLSGTVLLSGIKFYNYLIINILCY